MQRLLIRLLVLGLVVGGVYLFKNKSKNTLDNKNTVVSEQREMKGPEDAKNAIENEGISELTEMEKKVLAKKINKPVVQVVAKPVGKTSKTVVRKPVVVAKRVVKTTPIAKEAPKTAEPETVKTEEETQKDLPKTRVKVFMYDFAIDMSKRTFPAGEITFHVQNTGLFAHQFAIEGIKNWGLVGRNETVDFVVNLKPGKYKIWSEKDIDKKFGMVNHITVE